MFRKDRWVGLLYLSDNDAQTDAAGGPQDRNPGGLEDDGQTEERLHPGIWAPGQAHHVGRETHKQRRYKINADSNDKLKLKICRNCPSGLEPDKLLCWYWATAKTCTFI